VTKEGSRVLPRMSIEVNNILSSSVSLVVVPYTLFALRSSFQRAPSAVCYHDVPCESPPQLETRLEWVLGNDNFMRLDLSICVMVLSSMSVNLSCCIDRSRPKLCSALDRRHEETSGNVGVARLGTWVWPTIH
jgi:hypothetical protein